MAVEQVARQQPCHDVRLVFHRDAAQGGLGAQPAAFRQRMEVDGALQRLVRMDAAHGMQAQRVELGLRHAVEPCKRQLFGMDDDSPPCQFHSFPPLDQPFRAPIMMPLVKYFCKNG